MKRVEPAPWVLGIPPYVPGRSKEEIALLYGVSTPIKLASNENPLGPSPKAMQAVQIALGSSHLYPDPDSRALREAASRFFGCAPEHIIAGNGSDEILDLICRAFLRPADEVIIPECTFSYYAIASQACGAVVVPSPMSEHRIDVGGITARLSTRTRIVFVANPNNPTGAYLRAREVETLIRAVPDSVLIVMDEAYGAFARASDFSSCVPLTREHGNLVTVHTLSKSHGLAGLRVGFGIACKEVMDSLLRIKPPFNVNNLAQKAGEAALGDDRFLRETLRVTFKGLNTLAATFERLGLVYVPSQTNFMLVHIGSRCAQVYEDLLKRGIITRHMASFGLPEHLRVSVGNTEEMRTFVMALEEVL